MAIKFGKLGRLPAQFDPSVPDLLSLHLRATPPLPATEMRWKTVLNWPMLLNDQLGDCTIAGIGHAYQYWDVITSANTNGNTNVIVMTDDQALADYEVCGNYDPANPATDGGCVCLDVLKYFSQPRAIGNTQKTLTKFVSVPLNNIEQLKFSIHALGNCYLGINLPTNAETLDTWDVVKGSPIAGGHCVTCVGYDDPNSLIYLVTWGAVIGMTYNFYNTYVEEAWSLYSADWILNSGAHLGVFDHARVLNS